MFSVGEFARLAQVSTRLLRYYDQIGLLTPVRTDHFSGYRYYSATQLPQLNRILALKELGLSLDQIQRLLHDDVSTDEIQGMLLMKKAEIEQQLRDEMQRVRNIETRLQFIRNAEAETPLDIIVKAIPAQPVISVRTVIEDFDAGLGIFQQIMTALPLTSTYGLFFAIWHDGGPYERDSEIEIGRVIQANSHAPVLLRNNLELQYRDLPAAKTMATYVIKGWTENMHLGYSAIGTWAEVNGYRFTGPPREIMLQLPQAPDRSDGVTEIQYPLEPVHPS